MSGMRPEADSRVERDADGRRADGNVRRGDSDEVDEQRHRQDRSASPDEVEHQSDDAT
jgi:hypothetical protein